MDYREYTPDRRLSSFIECYWSAVADRPPFQEQEALIPDGTIELMFNFGDPYQHLLTDHRASEVRSAHLIGIRRKALLIAQSSRQDFFCVRFKPGGTFPFFKIPAHLFADTILHINELLPREYTELEHQLYELPNTAARIKLMDTFFLNKLGDLPIQWKTAQQFIGLSHTAPFRIRDTEYHYKTLERHFKVATGLKPEEFLKIRRFNRAVKVMYSGQCRTMTEVAYETGYYDQSHFIRDFKRFSGQTPLQFLKSRFKIVEVIQPALAERLSKSYNFSG